MGIFGKALALGAVTLAANAWATPATAAVTCVVKEKVQCSPGGGCQSLGSNIVIRIDFQNSHYSRCDSKGCDDFQAQISVSGEFINISLPERGMLAKMSRNGELFTEVITLMTLPIISFGSCSG